MENPIINHPFSKFVVSLIYYNTLVKDTLEYTLEKKYDENAFKYRKNGIINEPKLNSPLADFIKRNGENGQKFLAKIEDFADELYADDSTILHLGNEGLRVDHTQNLTIFEKVAPLHEELTKIIQLHVEHGKKEKIIENPVILLSEAEERFYRAVLMMSLLNELQKKFEEFNKIMNESKGQKTPASNFIEQELGRALNVYVQSKHYNTCKDKFYDLSVKAFDEVVDCMTGKQPLPEGKTFPVIFKETREVLAHFVSETEVKFRSLYEPCIKVLIDTAKANQNNKPAA